MINDKYVILVVSNDKYELPLDIFVNYQKMAEKLNITLHQCYDKVSKGNVDKKRNCMYRKVKIE